MCFGSKRTILLQGPAVQLYSLPRLGNTDAETCLEQPFIDKLGPSFTLDMLGATGYTTMDPMNLEAMLSTRFEGM